MDQKPLNSNSGTSKKKIRLRKQSQVSENSLKDAISTNSNSSDIEEEEFCPLAARDSEWKDLDFYKNYRRSFEQTDDKEEEIQTVDIDGEQRVPIFILFPGLREVCQESSAISQTESTANLTRMLFGQKADFSYLKSSKKIRLTDMKLPVLKEIPQEEEEEEIVEDEESKEVEGEGSTESKIVTSQNSDNKHKKKQTFIDEIKEIIMAATPSDRETNEHEETDDNNSIGLKKKIKRLVKKRKNSNDRNLESDSSHMYVNNKQKNVKGKAAEKLKPDSSHGSFGDDDTT